MSALPNINVKRITLSSSGKATDINADIVFSMFLKDSKTQDISRDRGTQVAFYNAVKILVVQITSESELNFAMTNTSEYVSATIKSNHTSKNKYVVCSIEDGNLFRLSRTNVEIVYRSPKSFSADTAKSSHLAYAFIPFVGNRDNISITGRPTIEEVINQGQVVKEAKVLLDPNGAIYTGPIHIHGKSIMAGAHHTSEPHPILTEQPVHNSTIHDLRIFENMKKVKMNTDSSTEKNTLSYISDLFVSRDERNNCRFLFFINFNKMTAAFSKIPMLHSNVIASHQITALSKITSIKILRRRSYGSDKNILFMPIAKQDSREMVEYIAVSKDNAPKQLESKDHFKVFGEESKRVGSIKEIKMNSLSQHLRAISGIDVEMSEITDGIYQYGVELQVEEGSKDFVRQKMADLKLARDTIENYHHRAIKEGSFDIIRNQFKETFRSEINRENVYKSVTKYIEILNLLKSNSSRQVYGESEISSIFSLICPINGTPKNIQKFRDLIGDLIISLDGLLQNKYSSRANKNYRLSGDAPERLKDDNPRTSRKIIKWFDTDFNSNLGKNTGYYFFKPTLQEQSGHMLLSDEDYVSLVESQAFKLFGSQKTLALSNNITLDINTTKYGYLSPLSVGLGGQEVEEFMQKDAQFYNIDKYNSIISELIRFNLNKPIAGKDSKTQTGKNEKLSVYGQKLRSNLIDIFSSLHCTVESIPAFATPSSKIKASQEVCKTHTTSIVDKDTSSKMTAVDTNVIKRQESPETLEDSKINPNNILNRLSSALAVTKIPSPKFFNVFDTRDNNFYLSNSPAAMDGLPNHIKAMIAMYSGFPTEIDKGKLAGNHRDQFGFLYMNFMNIMKVEVLAGFTGNNMTKPNFELINPNNLKRGMNLCRLTRYNSVSDNVPSVKFEYPVYYEYFILENTGALNISGEGLSRSARRQTRTMMQNTAATDRTISQDIRSKLSMMTENTNMYTRAVAPRTSGTRASRTPRTTTTTTTTPMSTVSSMPGTPTSGGGGSY